jgi:hypothetical protein
VLAWSWLSGTCPRLTPLPMAISRQRPSFFLIASGALFIVSCREPDAPFKITAPETTRDTRALAQVRVGEPVTLRATIKAHGSVKESEIAIALPELALLHGDTITVGGEKRVKRNEKHVGFSDGAVEVLTISVLIDTPGIYRAVATARTISHEPSPVNGLQVQETGADEIWLLFDGRRISVLKQADASSTPAGWATVPGAKQDRSGVTVTPFIIPCGDPGSDPSCNPGGGGGGPGGTYTLMGQWYNSDIGTYLPIKNATYQATDGTSSYSGATDALGRLFLPCPAGHYTITVDYRAPDKTQIQRGNVTIHAVTYQTLTNPCATTPSETYSTFDFNAAKVFDEMRTAVDSSRSFFQFIRSSVTVNLIDGSPPSEVSYYNPDPDKIWFKAGDIHGQRGAFVAAHEYGHALAQQTMGGARGGGCPSTHYIDGYYTLVCAISEGFADYHAAAARGPDLGFIYTDIRANNYYHGGDGSLDEGSVAAFLLDVSARASETDIINGSDYALHYTGRYVGEQMAGCQGQRSYLAGLWLGAEGIDVLVYCFEDQVDITMRNAYFPTRSHYVTAERSPATKPASWNRALIRRLWLRKLYGQ